MFQIVYKIDGTNWCYHAADKAACSHFVSILQNVNIGYDILENKAEMSYQLCGCLFKSDGQIYTYVRRECDAKPGMSASVEVVDNYGTTTTKEVIVVDTKMAKVSEIKAIAAKLGRDKLSSITKVWQRKIA